MITDEAFNAALSAYSEVYNETHGSYRKAVKAALESVFAMQEKPQNFAKVGDTFILNGEHVKIVRTTEPQPSYKGGACNCHVYKNQVCDLCCGSPNREPDRKLYGAEKDAVLADIFGIGEVEPEDNQGWIECDSGTEIFTKEEDGTIRLHGWLPSYATHYRIKPNTVKPEKKTLLHSLLSKHGKGAALEKLRNLSIPELIVEISEYLDQK